jgi:hypothetical protein
MLAVQPIDPHTGKRSQKKRRYLPRESDKAQKQRRSGQPVNEPTGRDPRHPIADQRNGLTAKKETKISMPQSAPRVGKTP